MLKKYRWNELSQSWKNFIIAIVTGIFFYLITPWAGGVAFLIVNILLYLANIQREKHEREPVEREKRINKVANEYIKSATSHPPIDSGIQGLIRADIQSLKNSDEINDLLNLIVRRKIKHPFNRFKEQVPKDGLKLMFDKICAGDINSFNLEQIISEVQEELKINKNAN